MVPIKETIHQTLILCKIIILIEYNLLQGNNTLFKQENNKYIYNNLLLNSSQEITLLHENETEVTAL